MLMKRLVAGAATVAIGLSLAATARAQSTATQTEEVVVTGKKAATSTGGLATQIDEAKDESIIQKEFIETQVPSANVATLINMLPGVSWSTEDPTGIGAGDLRIHGFDGAHVAFILDGAPLNDTGNYASYPAEYVIGELIDKITVNIGGSDVDSPSASALAATINVTSKKPSDTPGGELKLTTGSYAYGRAFGEFDTGVIGPWGTKAWFAAEDARADDYEGRPGSNMRRDVAGSIYQPLKGTDFLSVNGIFVQERLYNPFDVTQSEIQSNGFFFLGDNYTWVPETPTQTSLSTASKPGTPGNAGPAGTDANYYALFPNPVDFSSIRGQSKFTLGHGLTFTFDPAFFYTLANGGGGTTLSESSPLLIGAATPTTISGSVPACVSKGKVTGVDLSGNGNCGDTVVVYAPSNTQTFRYTLNSSLLYDFDAHNHFRIGYTWDYGQHRQTGEYTTVNPNTGDPGSIFGGKDGYGAPIIAADGSDLQKRNRRSIAELNQLSANYIGKFLDDRLHINLGVRAPFFHRELNNYCDTYNGTTVFCGVMPGVSQATLQADLNADLAAKRAPGLPATSLTAALRSAGVLSGTAFIATGANGVPDFLLPFTNLNKYYSKPLPNVGVSYRLTDNNFVYASYAAGFAAPTTDGLYSAPIDSVKPESSDNYTMGYRYETRSLYASINPYYTFYRNRIESTQDPNDPTASINRNVGNVEVYGVDFETGWTPVEHLHVYGSANFNHSALQDNYQATYTASSAFFDYIVPAKGKQMVLTPDQTYSTRVSYDFGPVTLATEGKYISRRYLTDTNDVSIGGYAVWNVDMRYNLPFFNKHSYIQANIQNLFNRQYYSRGAQAAFSSLTTSTGKLLTNSIYYYAGAPATAYVTLNAQF